jgi:hypothetical protein
MRSTFAFVTLTLLLASPSALAALDCPTLKSQLESLNPARADWKEVVIPDNKLEAALQALPAPHAPSPKELNNRLGLLKKDIESHFPAYLEDNYANCTMRRAELRTALLSTAAAKDNKDPVRTRISKAVRESLLSPAKFPTLISAIADARVLEHGVEAKVWQVSAKDLERIKALHQKIKDELAEENKTYGAPWNEVTSGLQKLESAEAKAKFLRESESFRQVRAHLLTEPADSAKHLRALRALAAKAR